MIFNSYLFSYIDKWFIILILSIQVYLLRQILTSVIGQTHLLRFQIWKFYIKDVLEIAQSNLLKFKFYT